MPGSSSKGILLAAATHAIAIAVSLVHAVTDATLLLALSRPSFAVFVAGGVAAYVLWVRSIVGLVRTGHGGRVAAGTALLWAGVANGGTIAFCPLTLCWPWATLLHVVVIVTAIAAAAAVLPYVRQRRTS